MLPARAVLRSTLSGLLLSAAVFGVYGASLRRGTDHARGAALATLLIGYQILVLVERAAPVEPAPGVSPGPSAHSFSGLSDLWPASLRFWVVWIAAASSLPVLMYTPAAATWMRVGPLDAISWLVALGAATLAVGWRVLVLGWPQLRHTPRAAPAAMGGGTK